MKVSQRFYDNKESLRESFLYIFKITLGNTVTNLSMIPLFSLNNLTIATFNELCASSTPINSQIIGKHPIAVILTFSDESFNNKEI